MIMSKYDNFLWLRQLVGNIRTTLRERTIVVTLLVRKRDNSIDKNDNISDNMAM